MTECRYLDLKCPSEQCKAGSESAKPAGVVGDLIPDDVAARTGPPLAGAGDQRNGTERTDRVGRGWDAPEFPAKQERRARSKQANEKKNRSHRRDDPNHPTDPRKRRLNRHRPEDNGTGNQRIKRGPLKQAASSRVRFAATFAAHPVSPKTNGQNWNPVEVSYIEAAYGDGSSRSVAREAVIIAKRNWLLSVIIGAANDAHGDLSKAIQPYISLQLYGSSSQFS